MRMKISVVLLLLALPAVAEPVVPTTIDYTFEHDDNSGQLVCGIVMTLANAPTPELVNFRLLAVKDKIADEVSLGFKLKVGDMLMRNGQPAGITVMKLKSAELTADGFNSRERLVGGPSDDGGIEMNTGVIVDVQTLYHVFVNQSFVLHFTPQAPIGMREYRITPAVPEDVQVSFQNCIDDF